MQELEDRDVGADVAAIGAANLRASAGFSPNGTRVVTARLMIGRASGGSSCRRELIDYARSILPRQLTPEQRKAFFLAAK